MTLGSETRAVITRFGGDRSPTHTARLSDNAAALTGEYIEDEQAVARSDQAQDDNLAQSLWERSTQLVSGTLPDAVRWY
jgi:hypothetical protein